MKILNLSFRFSFFLLAVLVGCNQQTRTNSPQAITPTITSPISTNTVIPTSTETATLQVTNTSIYKPTTTATQTPEPQRHLQLTFIKEKDGNQIVYALPLDCPGKNLLCVGEPEVLFKYDSPITSLKWSPDGQKAVLAALSEGGQDDIFVYDLKNNQATQITKNVEYEGNPAWVPNEDKIEFEACREGSCKIVRTDVDGTNPLTVLVDNNISSDLFLIELSRSSDGRKIAFRGSILEPYSGIFIANQDGTGMMRLTNSDSFNNYSPVFSPDGKWIAFIQDFDPNPDRSDIFLIHPDGTAERNLTNGLTPTQMFLDWSPVGDWIAFNGCITFNRCDLFIIKPDGLTSINLSKGKDWKLLGWRAYWAP
jgi:Tol biopolymer transport system component